MSTPPEVTVRPLEAGAVQDTTRPSLTTVMDRSGKLQVARDRTGRELAELFGLTRTGQCLYTGPALELVAYVPELRRSLGPEQSIDHVVYEGEWADMPYVPFGPHGQGKMVIQIGSPGTMSSAQYVGTFHKGALLTGDVVVAQGDTVITRGRLENGVEVPPP